MIRFIQEFVRWWLRELRELVPRSVREFLGGNIATFRLKRTGDGWQLTQISLFGRRRTLATGTWPEIRDRTFGHLRRWGALASLEIELPSDQCLIRNIALPAQALSEAEEIALLDLEYATPFDRGNAFVGHAIERGLDNHWRVIQYVAKDGLIAEPIADLESRGRYVRRILAVGTSNHYGVALGSDRPRPRSRTEAVLFGGATSASLVTVAAAAMLAGQTLSNQRRDIAMDADRLKAVRANVQALDKAQRVGMVRLAQARSARERRRRKVPPLQVLTEVTHRLPDSAWVQTFQLNGGVLHLSGSATSPEDLIKALSQSPLFDNVQFTSALTTRHGTTGEQFQIRLDVVSPAPLDTQRPANRSENGMADQ